MNLVFGEQRYLAVLLLPVVSLPLSFVFLQVFGDYYHFRHHAVEKRALSSHKGMHIKLQKEPQVRLLSGLAQHTVALLLGNKGPKDRLNCTATVYKSPEIMGWQH